MMLGPCTLHQYVEPEPMPGEGYYDENGNWVPAGRDRPDRSGGIGGGVAGAGNGFPQLAAQHRGVKLNGKKEGSHRAFLFCTQHLGGEQQEQWEEHHARYAEGAGAEVHRHERGDGRQPRLRGDELRLGDAAHGECAEVEDDERGPAGNRAEQQLGERPGNKHRSCAEHRQRVHERDEKGGEQGVALAQQPEAGEELAKVREQRIGLAHAASA